jgi:hypothetical protein
VLYQTGWRSGSAAQRACPIGTYGTRESRSGSAKPPAPQPIRAAISTALPARVGPWAGLGAASGFVPVLGGLIGSVALQGGCAGRVGAVFTVGKLPTVETPAVLPLGKLPNVAAAFLRRWAI